MHMFNRKTTQEKKRRDEINAKIKELQELIQSPQDQEKLTQSEVLNRAVELVTRMESESPGPSTNPNRKGFFDGFATIENLTYNFIRSLGMNSAIGHEFIQKAKLCFDRERAGLLMSTVGGSSSRKRKSTDESFHLPTTSSGYSEASSPSTSESGHCMDRKEVKKNREQDRRDRQGEAFDALKNFIIENKLMSSHQVEKMQRLNTLDIIINYVRNKKNNFVSRNGQDQSLYTHAIAEGQKTGRAVSFQFFKSDRHLIVRCADLEKFLDFSLAPKPLLGFPRTPQLPPSPAMLFPLSMNLPFLQFPFLPIPGLNPTTPTSPSYSLDSPPPASDTSSSSIESTTPNENSTSSEAPPVNVTSSDSTSEESSPPVKKKVKVFRPWE